MRTALFGILGILALMSFKASATVIGVDYLNDDKSQIIINTGLGESGFFHASHVCFTGKTNKDCAEIRKEAKASQEAYGDGEHGYFSVKSCEADATSIQVSYDRITDYGDEVVNLVIEECSLEIKAQI